MQECINDAVSDSQAILDAYNQVSVDLGEATGPEEMDKLMGKMEELTTQIDAANLWDLERVVKIRGTRKQRPCLEEKNDG